jgi:hypothetical protein
MKHKSKEYRAMTAAELRLATREFDSELPAGADGLLGRPLNLREQRQWNIVQKKKGRPRIGKGVKRVLVSLETDLLHRSDEFARQNHLSRSQMVSQGLRELMSR